MDPFPSPGYRKLVITAALVDSAIIILLIVATIGFLTDFYTISYWNFVIFDNTFLDFLFGGIMGFIIHFPRVILTWKMTKPDSKAELNIQLVTWRIFSTTLVVIFSVLSMIIYYFLLVFLFNAVLDTVFTILIWFLSRKLKIKANWKSIGQLKETLTTPKLIP